MSQSDSVPSAGQQRGDDVQVLTRFGQLTNLRNRLEPGKRLVVGCLPAVVGCSSERNAAIQKMRAAQRCAPSSYDFVLVDPTKDGRFGLLFSRVPQVRVYCPGTEEPVRTVPLTTTAIKQALSHNSLRSP